MGLFDRIFGRAPKPVGQPVGQFRLFTGYEPAWPGRGGNIYEMQMIRAAINAAATHISKLQPTIQGSAKPALANKLRHGPNEWQTWSQYLYRTATILYVHNTAYIVPVYDEYGEASGIYTVIPDRCEIVEYGPQKVPYLRYTFRNGQKAAIEFDACGILTRFQFDKDLTGETNAALYPTMDLIRIANKGIQEGVKNSAAYRFMARASNFAMDKDLAKERRRFSRENFADDAEAGGVLLFPNTYTDIKQLEAKPYTVEAEQMEIIRKGIADYFGISEDILQNKAYGDAWAAFYEGVIEPFAIQFSEVVSKMLYTFNERTRGNGIMLTSNRLQYLSNADKLQVSTQLVDRGIMSRNDAREIWNLPPVEGGDELVIRGEYYKATEQIGDNDEQNNG
jgi:HK97 family phage portal protein